MYLIFYIFIISHTHIGILYSNYILFKLINTLYLKNHNYYIINKIDCKIALNIILIKYKVKCIFYPCKNFEV